MDKILQRTYKDELTGGYFKALVQRNEIGISAGIIIKHLIAYPELIDWFEQENEAFSNSEVAEVSPFKNLFSYHRADKNFVLQTHNFTEISASNVGGASCAYLQENEFMYDLEGKIEKFQSSLGMKMQTKIGTQYEGTIFSVAFEWVLKE